MRGFVPSANRGREPLRIRCLGLAAGACLLLLGCVRGDDLPVDWGSEPDLDRVDSLSTRIEFLWNSSGTDLGRGVVDATLLPDGRVVALLSGECAPVTLVPKTMEVHRAAVRCGSGPGELRAPVAIGASFAGNVFIWDGARRIIAVFNPGSDSIAREIFSDDFSALQVASLHVLDDSNLVAGLLSVPEARTDSTSPMMVELRVGGAPRVSRRAHLGFPRVAIDRRIIVATSLPFCSRGEGPTPGFVVLSRWAFALMQLRPDFAPTRVSMWSEHKEAVLGEEIGGKYSRMVGGGIVCTDQLTLATMILGERRGKSSTTRRFLTELRGRGDVVRLRRLGDVGEAGFLGVPLDARGDTILFRDNQASGGPLLRLVRFPAALSPVPEHFEP